MSHLITKPNRWTNWFAVFEVRPDETFTPIYLSIVNGAVTYGGETFQP